MRDFITFSQIINAVVGKIADTASETGTVHAKLTSLISRVKELNSTATASNTIQFSAPAQRTTQSTSFVKLKEIQVPVSGTVRVSFTLANYNATGYCTIYKNGVATASSFSQGNTPAVKTADITVAKYDLIQLYAYSASTSHVTYVYNNTIGYDLLPLGGVIID